MSNSTVTRRSSIGDDSPEAFSSKCPVCGKVYYNRDQLAEHQKAKFHYRCERCEVNFRDSHDFESHNEKKHGSQQDIDCPGCGQNFTRAGGLVHHIEQRQCPVMTPEMLHTRRNKLLEFEQGLRALNPANNYEIDYFDGHYDRAGRYRPVDNPDFMTISMEPTTIPREPKNFPMPGEALSAYRSGYSKGPDLLTGAEFHSDATTGSVWAQKKNWIATFGARNNARTVTAEDFAPPIERKTEENPFVLDPDERGFNAAVFRDPVLDKFMCPHIRCKSKFAKSSGLIAHLKSPAHNNKFGVTCPQCLRKYNSMTSAIQHAESATRICQIRDGALFKKFVADVTGGLFDVLDDDRLQDGGAKFAISATFIKSLPAPYNRVPSASSNQASTARTGHTAPRHASTSWGRPDLATDQWSDSRRVERPNPVQASIVGTPVQASRLGYPSSSSSRVPSAQTSTSGPGPNYSSNHWVNFSTASSSWDTASRASTSHAAPRQTASSSGSTWGASGQARSTKETEHWEPHTEGDKPADFW